MRIHIKTLQGSPDFLNKTILTAQELWLQVNPEQTKEMLLFTIGDHIEQSTDLYIEVIDTNQIKVGFPLENDLEIPIQAQRNLHWLIISEWTSDKTSLIAKFLTFLVGTIRTPSQMGTYMMDFLDLKKAMQLGTEATYLCLTDSMDLYAANLKNTISSIMLLNTKSSLSNKLSLARDLIPQDVDEDSHLNILNITDNPHLPRTNIALFIINKEYKIIH